MAVRGEAASFLGDGYIQELRWIGQPSSRVFVSSTLPVGPALGGGLVICSPIHAEFLRNYRKEVALGWMLASHGVAVQRFHYRGMGDSDDIAGDATLGTMVEDALLASADLQSRIDSDLLAFMGTRFGALVAAQVASRFDRAPLVLWEPVVDPAKYLRELLRARLLHDLVTGVPRQNQQVLMEQLDRDEQIDILGYPVSASLVESSLGQRLDRDLPASPRPILLVQVGLSNHLAPYYEQASSSWTASGSSVRTAVILDEEGWSFAPREWQVDETGEGQRELLGITADWLRSSLADAGSGREE